MPERALNAISYHSALLPGRALTVRAIFSRAWHLQDAGGWIVTVSTAPYDGPLGIRLALPDLRQIPIHPGQPARLTRDVMEIGPLRIALRHARPWTAALPSARPLDRACLRSDLERIVERSRLIDSGGLPAYLLAVGLEDRDTSREVGALHALARALRGRDSDALSVAAYGLLGLGPGLTPSGDDVLCGVLIGLHILGDRRLAGDEHRQALRTLTTLIGSEAGRRTTALSRTLLHHAAQGVAMQPLLDILCTLGTGSDLRGLEMLFAVGHTSGSDMLAGVCLAGTAVLGWEEAFDPSLARSE